MIQRGKPFPRGEPLILCCPVCLSESPPRYEALSAGAVFALGPTEQIDRMNIPYYRYRCAVCRYVEVHMYLLRGRTTP